MKGPIVPRFAWRGRAQALDTIADLEKARDKWTKRSSPKPTSAQSGELLAGALPRAQTRLVQAWIEIHQDELAAAWQMAVNGFRPGKIAPLQ